MKTSPKRFHPICKTLIRNVIIWDYVQLYKNISPGLTINE